MSFYVVESRRVDKASGLRCDQTIRLKAAKARRDYPGPPRRVCYYDEETKKHFVFLTNNFEYITDVTRRRDGGTTDYGTTDYGCGTWDVCGFGLSCNISI
jgi:hypothetical protein